MGFLCLSLLLLYSSCTMFSMRKEKNYIGWPTSIQRKEPEAFYSGRVTEALSGSKFVVIPERGRMKGEEIICTILPHAGIHPTEIVQGTTVGIIVPTTDTKKGIIHRIIRSIPTKKIQQERNLTRKKFNKEKHYRQARSYRGIIEKKHISGDDKGRFTVIADFGKKILCYIPRSSKLKFDNIDEKDIVVIKLSPTDPTQGRISLLLSKKTQQPMMQMKQPQPMMGQQPTIKKYGMGQPMMMQQPQPMMPQPRMMNQRMKQPQPMMMQPQQPQRMMGQQPTIKKYGMGQPMMMQQPQSMMQQPRMMNQRMKQPQPTMQMKQPQPMMQQPRMMNQRMKQPQPMMMQPQQPQRMMGQPMMMQQPQPTMQMKQPQTMMGGQQPMIKKYGMMQQPRMMNQGMNQPQRIMQPQQPQRMMGQPMMMLQKKKYFK